MAPFVDNRYPFSFSRKRFEERHEVFLVLRGQVQGNDRLVQTWILIAAAIVKIDDVFQRGQAAVVHVRGRERDVAKRGRLESAAVRFLLRDRESTQVNRRLIPAHSRVVITLIREIGAGMAAPTSASTFIQP